MATYNIVRPLRYKAKPMTLAVKLDVLALLDEWHRQYSSLPNGGFTDLCEHFSSYPDEMRQVVGFWRRRRRRQWRRK